MEIKGYQYVGAFAGENQGQIQNCHAITETSSSTVRGEYVIGGIAGSNKGTISNSSVMSLNYNYDFLVRAEQDSVGGITGQNGAGSGNYGIVEYSFVDCFVEGRGDHSGGITGWNFDKIVNSGFKGKMNGRYDYNGGISGENDGVIFNSYYNGIQVLGAEYIGGIVGYNKGNIDNCYVSGQIGGLRGAITGWNIGTVTDCFWDTQTTGLNIATYDGSIPINTYGKTTAEMKKLDTYTVLNNTDWDFINIWTIQEDVDYPRLRTAGKILDTPTGLNAISGENDGVHLSWNPVNFNPAGSTQSLEASYRIYRSDSADAESLKVAVSNWIASTEFIDSTAIPDQQYFYWVTAAANLFGARESQFGGGVSGSRNQPIASAPSDVQVFSGFGSFVLIEWSTVPNGNYYKVYRSTNGGEKEALSDWQTTRSFMDNTGDPNVEYSYWVTASADNQGTNESDYSLPVTGAIIEIDEVEDNCPNDPNKTEPGICGCGVSDDDSDEDGTSDCLDNCPEDPDKTEPGICGCGASETDSDGDGTLDCNEHSSNALPWLILLLGDD
ncbi:fibronectin type III domain-containing protein [Thermodesulfobacteriota bacterium]